MTPAQWGTFPEPQPSDERRTDKWETTCFRCQMRDDVLAELRQQLEQAESERDDAFAECEASDAQAARNHAAVTHLLSAFHLMMGAD
jgi:hypothetical protein